MTKKIIGTRTITMCYECEHYRSKSFKYESENPYGRETSMWSTSHCDLDGELSIAGNDIPEHCPLFGTPKPPKQPNRIIVWRNDEKYHGEISVERNGLKTIEYIQDEPGGKTYKLTLKNLDDLLKKYGDKYVRK